MLDDFTEQYLKIIPPEVHGQFNPRVSSFRRPETGDSDCAREVFRSPVSRDGEPGSLPSFVSGQADFQDEVKRIGNPRRVVVVS